MALSTLPGVQVCKHMCTICLEWNDTDCWHKITPTGSESHSDIAFFLSSQPLAQSLHPHQIFFYSCLRGKQGGKLRRELTHTECRHSLLYPAPFPNFTHSCTSTHSACCILFNAPQAKPQCSFSLSVYPSPVSTNATALVELLIYNIPDSNLQKKNPPT